MANVGSFTSSPFEGLDYNPVGTPFTPDWNDKLSGTTKQNSSNTSARVVIMSSSDRYIASTHSTSGGEWSLSWLPKKDVDGKEVVAIAYFSNGSPDVFDKIITVA